MVANSEEKKSKVGYLLEFSHQEKKGTDQNFTFGAESKDVWIKNVAWGKIDFYQEPIKKNICLYIYFFLLPLYQGKNLEQI